jgi:hypothetical protein
MTQPQPRSISRVVATILRWVLDTCIWMAPACGMTIPPQFIDNGYDASAFAGDDRSPARDVTRSAVHSDLPYPISLSAAEREQWESLIKDLDLAEEG